MKRFFIVMALFVSVAACKQKESTTPSDSTQGEAVEAMAAVSQQPNVFGEAVAKDNLLAQNELFAQYATMEAGDTLQLNVSGTVKEVCQMKGCWMTLVSEEGNQEIRVTFKDYGFFVPKDLSGKRVTMTGKAFLQEIDVETLKHLAEDGGKSKEEIEAITTPEITYSFEASGVALNY